MIAKLPTNRNPREFAMLCIGWVLGKYRYQDKSSAIIQAMRAEFKELHTMLKQELP